MNSHYQTLLKNMDMPSPPFFVSTIITIYFCSNHLKLVTRFAIFPTKYKILPHAYYISFITIQLLPKLSVLLSRVSSVLVSSFAQIFIFLCECFLFSLFHFYVGYFNYALCVRVLYQVGQLYLFCSRFF